MKKAAFLFILVLLYCPTFAQNAIKIGAKVNASSLTNNNTDIDIFEQNKWTVAPSIGLDWLSHTYWYLSSEMSLVTIGGKSDVYTETLENATMEVSWKYLEQNTKFRFQYPLSTMSLYAGAGMFIRERVSSASCTAYESADVEAEIFDGASFLYGEVFECGITTTKGRLKADFNVCYYLRNNHIAKRDLMTLYPKTWGLGLSFGYIL